MSLKSRRKEDMQTREGKGREDRFKRLPMKDVKAVKNVETGGQLVQQEVSV